MRTRYTVLAVVVVALAIPIATGGFGPAQFDRGAAIDVVGDSTATVGYEATCEHGRFVVTITNNVDEQLDDVTVAVNGSRSTAAPLPVAPGASRTVSFGVGQVAPGDAVTVHAGGSDVQAVLDRTVPGDCVAGPGDT